MITLESTNDMGLIRKIVISPDIWERIADGVDSDYYFPTTDSGNQWILVLNNNKTIGVIYIHCDTSCSIGFHPYLLKDHRIYGIEMMKAFFEWFIEYLPEEYVKINVIIPECFASVVSFARKVGFKKEGICRNSYTKSGNIYNRVMLGITRDEVLEWAA